MNTKAMEAAIKRLIKYCGKANKEINQSIESRKLVMDIEMIYSGLIEIMEQRDAALKLADGWASTFGFLRDNQWQTSADMTAKVCADELRAIFAPKDGK